MTPQRRQHIKRLIDDLMEARVRNRYKAVDLKLFDADDILSALRDLWAEVERLKIIEGQHIGVDRETES